MRALRPTAIPAFERHERIAKSKQEPTRSIVLSMSTQVDRRIQDLAAAGPINFGESDLGHVCASPECEGCPRRALRSLYETQTAALEDLKADIKAEFGSVQTCPYCGIDSARTFDHYLPKGKYPEFAVTSHNLVPCCFDCNLRKGELSPTSTQRMLHPVHDPVEHRLLKCEITDSGGVPVSEFSIDDAQARGRGVLDACRFHFDRLELGTRLADEANTYLTAFLEELERLQQSQGAESAHLAEARADGYRAVYGPNSWRVLLFDTLADWMRTK